MYAASGTGSGSAAASAGIQLDFVNAGATSSVGAASLVISQSFPPTPASLLLAYLNVNATNFYRERQFQFGLRLRF